MILVADQHAGDVYRQNRFLLCSGLLLFSVLLVRKAVV